MPRIQNLIRDFSKKLDIYPEDEKKKILHAARWASGLHQNQKRASGEPYFIHPLKVAEILVETRMDSQTVIAGLLHDVLEDTEINPRELRREYGKEVEALVRGVTKISVIRGMSKSIQQAETIRKMLFAMVKDVRVILIKLADKLHNMSTLEYLDEKSRKRIATECLEIYAPLAGRLGISRIKSELEDLSLKYLNPEVYDQIVRFVAEKRKDRSGFLMKRKEIILNEAAKANINIEFETRAKSLYSIYRKMKKKGKFLDEIYDLFGLRILCDTPSLCYELLGIAHNLWKPIEGRFKDYIAMPKSNRYQSLHTTVMGEQGRMFEIQIRTHEMHQTAEQGIAAHWFYKSKIPKDAIKPEQLTIINILKNWDNRKAVSAEFLEEIKKELLKDSIYVFTPKGDIIELPKGSTALDFAYHIHTEVGNHCLAAKADGVIIQLKKELKNTQVIEIITSNTARPHLNWLRFVHTSRTRTKIRQWLNRHDANLIIDRNIVARKTEKAHPAKAAKEKRKSEPETKVLNLSKIGLRIGNERNMMIRPAKCCEPTMGDAIIGYISRGRGIIVHKKTCPNLKDIKDFAERSIVVEWESISPKAARRFHVTARRASNLFSEIEGAIKKYSGHLIEGKLDESSPDVLEGFFTVELDSGEDFKHVVKSLRAIPSVMNIRIESA